MPATPARGSRSALIAFAFALLSTAATFSAAQSVTEFPVPTPDADIHGMTVGPDGALWFNESAVGKVGRIAMDGTITEFQIVDSSFNIATGPDGNLWYTPYGGIGRITPQGVATKFSPPDGIDPGEFSTWDIVRGPDDAMWFTVVQGYIGRIDMQGSMTLFPVPTTHSTQIYGLAFGPDGNIWYGDPSGVLGRMTPTGTITEFPGWAPFDLAIGPDGQLWGSGFQAVARISMDGSIELFPAGPYRTLTAGPDGNLWMALSTTTIGRLTLSGELTEFTVPTDGHGPFGPGAWPFAVVAGPDGNIWFTEEFGNKIGRVNLTNARVVERPAPERRLPREHPPRD